MFETIRTLWKNYTNNHEIMKIINTFGYVFIEEDTSKALESLESSEYLYRKYPISTELAEFIGCIEPNNCVASLYDAIESIHVYLKTNKIQQSSRLFVLDTKLTNLLRITTGITEIRWLDIPKRLFIHFRVFSLIVTIGYEGTIVYTFIHKHLFDKKLQDLKTIEKIVLFVSETPSNVLEDDNIMVFKTTTHGACGQFKFPENIAIDKVYTIRI